MATVPRLLYYLYPICVLFAIFDLDAGTAEHKHGMATFERRG